MPSMDVGNSVTAGFLLISFFVGPRRQGFWLRLSLSGRSCCRPLFLQQQHYHQRHSLQYYYALHPDVIGSTLSSRHRSSIDGSTSLAGKDIKMIFGAKRFLRRNHTRPPACLTTHELRDFHTPEVVRLLLLSLFNVFASSLRVLRH